MTTSFVMTKIGYARVSSFDQDHTTPKPRGNGMTRKLKTAPTSAVRRGANSFDASRLVMGGCRGGRHFSRGDARHRANGRTRRYTSQ
jgi:hypothetical protein